MNIEERTEIVAVPEFGELFDEGEKPEFKIKALTLAEYTALAERVKQANNTRALFEVLAKAKSGEIDEKAKSQIADVFGVEIEGNKKSLEDSEEYQHFINTIELGLVSPKLKKGDIKKLGKYNAPRVRDLGLKILTLTGVGNKLGKPGSSGSGKTSKPA